MSNIIGSNVTGNDDLQSAGVQAPDPRMSQPPMPQPDFQADAGSLLRALSQGPMQQAQANPDMANWTGLAGFGAGMMGQANPVINQLQLAQEADRRQKMATFEVMDAVQRRRRQQSQDQLAILNELANSNDAKAREAGWTGKAKIYSSMGVPVSQEMVQGLVKKSLPDGKLKEIGHQLTFLSPDRVLELNPDVSPQIIAELQQNQNNPGYRRFLNLPTVEEEKIKNIEIEQKSLNLLQDKYGLEDKKIAASVNAYHMQQFGKPFFEGTDKTRAEAMSVVPALTLPKSPWTNLQNDAIVEVLGKDPREVKDPATVQLAVNQYRAKRQKEMLDRAAQSNQLSAVGQGFRQELNRVNQAQDRFAALDQLIGDMERLTAEGKRLGMTGNPRAINTVKQELAYWTGGPKSERANWVAAFESLDARFANAAQAIEGITGNRLAVENTKRALAFHPKATEPYGVQERRIQELKGAARGLQGALREDLARSLRQYEAAAATAGVPFILGQGNKGWSAEEEQ